MADKIVGTEETPFTGLRLHDNLDGTYSIEVYDTSGGLGGGGSPGGAVTQATSPWVVSVATLPLPTGAATSAAQATGNDSAATTASSSASVDSKTPAPGQAAMAQSSPVVIASNQSTLPVSAASLPLPTGAATSALQTTGNASAASIDTKTPALGQAAMAASVPVTLASNQPALPASQSGVWTFLRTSSTTSAVNAVAGSATVVTLAATNAARLSLFVFNDSNATLYLRYGAGASLVSYSVKIAAGGYWEMPDLWRGAVTGIWDAADGNALVTETT